MTSPQPRARKMTLRHISPQPRARKNQHRGADQEEMAAFADDLRAFLAMGSRLLERVEAALRSAET